MLCCVVLCCVVLCCLVLSCNVLCCVVLCCLVLSCLVLSCLVLSCNVMCCVVLSCLVLSCNVLCCVVFCHIMRHVALCKNMRFFRGSLRVTPEGRQYLSMISKVIYMHIFSIIYQSTIYLFYNISSIYNSIACAEVHNAYGIYVQLAVQDNKCSCQLACQDNR